jgi:predicted metal-dependent peptidase
VIFLITVTQQNLIQCSVSMSCYISLYLVPRISCSINITLVRYVIKSVIIHQHYNHVHPQITLYSKFGCEKRGN